MTGTGNPRDSAPPEHTRALLLAEAVSESSQSELWLQMNSATVRVSIDMETPGAFLCARTLLATLRRMPCQLVLDPAGLTSQVIACLVERVAEIDPVRGMTVRAATDAAGVAHLHVGTRGPSTAIRLIPEGHGGHLMGVGGPQVRPSREPTALGSIFTAALGAGEAFKAIARVQRGRRIDHEHLSFCPVSLTTDLHCAPELPVGGTVDVALVGLGAVGTAHALILSELPWRGRVALVDGERFSAENRGTYAIGTDEDARRNLWKVDLAARILSRYDVSVLRGSALDYIHKIDNDGLHWPSIVLSGLDSIDARHDAQGIWPDDLIDSATGDTVVGLHHAAGQGACLMCFLPKRTDGPSSIERLSEMTGLAVSVLLEDADLTEEEVAAVPVDKRGPLEAYIGQPKCGLARAFGLSDLDSVGYRPSIPFVSLQAACLGVGRLIAIMSGFEPRYNFFQYDALLGPDPNAGEQRLSRPACYCQEHRNRIVGVRDIRQSERSANL